MAPARIQSLLVVGFMLTVLAQPSLAIHPQEDQEFSEVHEGPDFPVGWVTGHIGEGSEQTHMQVVYPAMADGEGEDMAGNGPFPWIQFIGDEGEDFEQYQLLATSIAKRGHIVVVHAGVSDATDFDELLSAIQRGYQLMITLNESNTAVTGSFGQIDLDHWGLAGHGYALHIL